MTPEPEPTSIQITGLFNKEIIITTRIITTFSLSKSPGPVPRHPGIGMSLLLVHKLCYNSSYGRNQE